MRSLCIVPEQMFHETNVESDRIQEFWFMVINVFFLDSTVEAFDMGIHLWSSGIGVPVCFVQSSHLDIKVFHKLRTIIGKHEGQAKGKQKSREVKKFLGSHTGMAIGCPCQRKPTCEISKGNHLPTRTMDDLLHGIKRHTMSRMSGNEMSGFAQTFGAFPWHDLSIVAHLDGKLCRPPISFISRPMVDGLGQGMFFAWQKDARKMYTLSLPKLGCSSRRRRISSRTGAGHSKRRFLI